ncbi:MAG TPA: prolyl oligopeptidase family serine peptidase [Isosphaeraceae bacterium]|nr:prolyl oligopeptidase family serine peptidase [Isosphaeraceae bacterium]
MRRFAVLACLLLASPVVADDDLSVLKPGPGDPSPRTLLASSLRDRARAALEARRKAVAALQTKAQIAERQERIKAKFLEALGDFPEKTPLNARVVGQTKRDGYRMERVIYESRPGHHVTAALYVPDGNPPFPGVLVPCGHSQNGKAAEAYQRASILLAKNGMVVLCFDPIGQGERVQLLDSAGKPAIAGSTTEHSMAGIGALLVGRCAANYFVWDAIRSLDYLASRPEVDPNRLGCTGNSGGGTQTSYLMALDDRIAAAAPSCYITSLDRLFSTIGPQDAEQNIPGQVAFGMDHADYAIMRAPKPTLLSVGTRDFFDIQGSWDTFRELKLLFGKLGHGERIDLFESDEEHGFTRPRRESAMRWMRRWLLKIDDAPTEDDFPIFTDQELQCTKSGQVLSDFQDVTVFDFNRERARKLQSARATNRLDRAQLLEKVRSLIAWHDAPAPAIGPARVPGEVVRSGCRVETVVFGGAHGILLPGLLFQREGATDDSPLLVVVGGDKAELARPGGFAEEKVKSGSRVLLVDLPGMGETAPREPGNARRSPFGPDSKEAMLALHLARPLLGQRVADLVGVIESMAPRAPQGVHLWAFGSAGPIALHAAALDQKVAALTMEKSLVSWAEVVETPISRDQLANVVPGALTVYDLPELAATLAPRPLTIRAAVDGSGAPVDQASLEKAYATCKSSYGAQNAEGKLSLDAQP